MKTKRNTNGSNNANSGKIRQVVRAMIQSSQEVKTFAVENAAAVAIVATGTGYRLSGGIIAGTNSSQRTGSEIQVKKLNVIFQVNGSAASNTSARILIVQDKQANATDMTIQSLLNAASTFSEFNPQVQGEQARFRVLVDRFVNLSFNGNNRAVVRFNLKPSPMIQYLDTTDASTACGKNFIWAWVIGDNTSATYVLDTMQYFTDS